MINGIDVSSYQGKIAWGKVANAGYKFAFIRATRHVPLGSDPMFVQNWTEARSVGLVVGAYHYLDPDSDLSEQVDNFLRRLQPAPVEPGILPPVLDVEEGEFKPIDLRWCLDRVEQHTGLVPILYTCVGWWAKAIGNDDQFARYPLWVADWSPPPSIPKPWTDYLFWQHSSAGRVPGVSGAVDLDIFNGDDDMLALIARTKP